MFSSIAIGVVADPLISILNTGTHIRNAALRVTLGEYDDVFSLSGGTFDEPLVVDGGGGNDTFHIKNDAITRQSVTLNGDGGDDLVFVNYIASAPSNAISSLTFNGGDHGANGDTPRCRRRSRKRAVRPERNNRSRRHGYSER